MSLPSARHGPATGQAAQSELVAIVETLASRYPTRESALLPVLWACVVEATALTKTRRWNIHRLVMMKFLNRQNIEMNNFLEGQVHTIRSD